MNLSIIIVNYKSKDKTAKCLESLEKAEWGGLSYEIIVVDNASGDNLLFLKKAHPEIKIIQSEKNLGMGGGNNLGIKNSSGEFILILNPDTEVKSGAVLKLFNYLKRNESAGIVGPKLLNPDGSLQYSCLRFPKILTPLLRRTFLGKIFYKSLDKFLMKDFNHNETRGVDWLMGSCLLVRRELLDVSGRLFDERFFMYFEDTELCRRARRFGWKSVYLPEAEVFHDHARASAEKSWYIAPFVDRLAREHIKSWFKYFFKNI
jgi:GT2 family glycosyltransferase